MTSARFIGFGILSIALQNAKTRFLSPFLMLVLAGECRASIQAEKSSNSSFEINFSASSSNVLPKSAWNMLRTRECMISWERVINAHGGKHSAVKASDAAVTENFDSM